MTGIRLRPATKRTLLIVFFVSAAVFWIGVLIEAIWVSPEELRAMAASGKVVRVDRYEVQVRTGEQFADRLVLHLSQDQTFGPSVAATYVAFPDGNLWAEVRLMAGQPERDRYPGYAFVKRNRFVVFEILYDGTVVKLEQGTAYYLEVSNPWAARPRFVAEHNR